MKVLIGGQIEKGGTVNFCVKAFRTLGVEVVVVNYNEYFHLSFVNRVVNKFLKTPWYFGVGVLNSVLIEKTEKFSPDFVLLFKPVFIFPKTVEKMKKITKVFSWYPDFILFTKTASTLFFQSIPLYDAHFSFNFENAEELKKLGVKNSFFLPCAFDPDCHAPSKILEKEKTESGSDIVFVGTYAKERRSEYLERLCGDGYDIKIYGNGWEGHPKNSCLWRNGCIRSKTLHCRDMSKTLSLSKVVVAFVRDHNKETLACRTYEIPACGAFMLHQRTSKIGEVLEEGKEAEFFSSYEEMRKKIDFYLKNEDLRKEIAERGKNRVLREDLFIHRIEKIFEVFKELG